MNMRCNHLVFPALISTLIGVGASVAVGGELAERIKQAAAGHFTAEPSRHELAATERAFELTLAGREPFDALREKWRKLDFELTAVPVKNGTVWLVSEQPEHLRGRGIYAFRTGANSLPLILQAPHRFYDRGTRQITTRLFLEGPFRAAAWNTVHRSETDLAHAWPTCFNAFTRAAIRSHGAAAIVQLHGFAAGKRKTSAATTADVILSNGAARPGHEFLAAAEVWRRQWADVVVRIYPQDVRELGGRTNVQGQIARQLGNERFFHVEMNASLRDSLRSRQSARREFLKLLEKSYRSISPE